MTTLLLIASLFFFLGCGWIQANVAQTPPQAVQTAFPSHQVDRKTLFLTADQKQQVEQLSRTKVDSSIISYYVARSSAGVAGIAFFDRRMVRSLPVTYMAVLTPSGAIDHVDILAFEEPDDYFPPARWLALYKNRTLDNHLTVGDGIPHITGASLTSQAMNDGLRMILAIYQVGVQGRSNMLQRYVMGTFLSVSIRADDAAQTREAYALFFDEIQRLERLLSIYRSDSDLSRINQAAGMAPVHVSSDTFRLLEEALYYAKESAGAFDPTLGHYSDVCLNAADRTVFLSAPELRLDLGGIGKGFALDRALEQTIVLSTVQSVRADFGGQLLFWDRTGRFSPEYVAIENPMDRRDVLTTFKVGCNCSVSTSSNAERPGHLTDPRTNSAACGSLSATAVAATATEAEALSTALFVLDERTKTKFLQKYPDARGFVY